MLKPWPLWHVRVCPTMHLISAALPKCIACFGHQSSSILVIILSTVLARDENSGNLCDNASVLQMLKRNFSSPQGRMVAAVKLVDSICINSDASYFSGFQHIAFSSPSTTFHQARAWYLVIALASRYWSWV